MQCDFHHSQMWNRSTLSPGFIYELEKDIYTIENGNQGHVQKENLIQTIMGEDPFTNGVETKTANQLQTKDKEYLSSVLFTFFFHLSTSLCIL